MDTSMLRSAGKGLAGVVGVVAVCWQLLVALPIFMGLEWAPIRSKQAICLMQMKDAIGDIQRDIAAGKTADAAWRANDPGHCPGLGASENSYLFIEAGFTDTEVPIIICRRGGHLGGSGLALAGIVYADQPSDSLLAGYASGDVMRVNGDTAETLMGELKATPVHARDRTGAVVAIDSSDPGQRQTAWYFHPYRGTCHPLIIIFLAAVAYFACSRDGATEPAPSE